MCTSWMRSDVVPGATSDRIQEVHIKVVHLLVELIEETLFGFRAV